MGKIKQPLNKKGKVPSSATVVKTTAKPSVGWELLDETVVALTDVEREFFQTMVKTLKILCSLPWTDVSSYKGLGLDRVPESSMKFPIPAKLNKDHLYHIKVSRGGRLWGYRDGDVFELVWLDPLHRVTPE
ncbi:MAG6450 family protein [Tumebacillus permanentifrigoris]|uniref:Uncharacterized protein n=1 Tax=Tumebacillus permanentifrigoris TaxID=378543 RepID=A0A316DAU7_9BACL|nr:hypothetical protein [Tumebacillus permanentifrigoris]PWK14932.1 hypothetical protein C7459_104134 [Tumebacillus permanentifrigoris]